MVDEARAAVAVQACRERRRQRRARQSFLAIASDRVTLGFPYDTEMVGAAQKIPGRRYHADSKTNSYPLSSLPAVAAFAEKYGIPVDDQVRAQLDLVPAVQGKMVAREGRSRLPACAARDGPITTISVVGVVVPSTSRSSVA